jgi:hypothetical protein
MVLETEMTKLMKAKILFMITGMVIFSFGSCMKDTGIDQSSLDHADNDAMADAVYEDVFNTADNAAIIVDNMGFAKSSEAVETVFADSCPVITVTRPTANPWPKLVKVDYGTGCLGLNDNTRKGKILIEITGPRLQTGSKRTVTFDNYYFNDMKIEGTKVLENKGYNADQHLLISEKLTGGKVTFADGKTVERAVDHQREWTAGLLTKNIWDDECLVTGTATGKNRNDVTYTNTILTALHWTRACRFIVAGTVKMERSGDTVPVVLDYGTGDCDAKAVVTRGEQTKEILLRFKR